MLRQPSERISIWPIERKGVDLLILADKGDRQQSTTEEIVNSISHGIGLIAAFVGTPILVTQAARNENGQFLIGVGVFCATMLMCRNLNLI